MTSWQAEHGRIIASATGDAAKEIETRLTATTDWFRPDEIGVAIETRLWPVFELVHHPYFKDPIFGRSVFI
jgi:hypothetical protein